LVVRREAGELRRYVHLSTGNYNATTARLYTDMGLFTADTEIGEDASGPGCLCRVADRPCAG
jgi:polyphosphate kinase